MKRVFCVILIFVIAVLSYQLKAQENQAKAMYIYNFSRLVKWPDEYMKDNFVIGIFGDEELYKYLESYTKNKKVGMLDIKVVKYDNISEISNCHILYIPEYKSSKIKEILSVVGKRPILIISGKEGLVNFGSVIDFVIVENKLKFKISEQNAQRQNLLISKTLLDMSI